MRHRRPASFLPVGQNRTRIAYSERYGIFQTHFRQSPFMTVPIFTTHLQSIRN